MKSLRPSGLLAYVAMAMWLLQLAVSPVRAEGAAEAPSRLADHVAEIRAALIAHGASENVRVTLSAPDAAVAAPADGALRIESLSFNPATGRFLARAQGAPGTPLVAVTGTAVTAVLIPVPARAIVRNEVLAESDLDWIEISDAQSSQYVADADAIIGKIARRPLAAGAPLRGSDLAAPIVVKRGATVTIVLEAPGIRLTQNAVALENGALGELIGFRNANSNRDIKAVVAGAGLATAPFVSRSTYASLSTEQP